MKESWILIAVLIGLVLVAGIIASAIEFFQKVWEHVNQPNGNSLTFQGKKIDFKITTYSNKPYIVSNFDARDEECIKCNKCGAELVKIIEE